MVTHTCTNLKYGVLRSTDYRLADGRLIHMYFITISYDNIVWC